MYVLKVPKKVRKVNTYQKYHKLLGGYHRT